MPPKLKIMIILICPGQGWTQIYGTTTGYATNWATLACLSHKINYGSNDMFQLSFFEKEDGRGFVQDVPLFQNKM